MATPDIPALFLRPAWNLSLKPGADAHDLVRTVDGYGADHRALEEAEAEYRARREEAKVWRRERDEVNRQVLEARALQAQKYCEDIASRVERTIRNEEEERMAELKRVKEAERVQIEEKKRIEEERQFVEKRRESEKRKKEERKKREEEKRKEDEERQKRRKAVEAAPRSSWPRDLQRLTRRGWPGPRRTGRSCRRRSRRKAPHVGRQPSAIGQEKLT